MKPSDRNFSGLAKLKAQIFDQLHGTPYPNGDLTGVVHHNVVGLEPGHQLTSVKKMLRLVLPVESS